MIWAGGSQETQRRTPTIVAGSEVFAMLVKKRAIMILAIPLLCAGKPREHVISGEQTVLSLDAHKYNYSFKVKLEDGQELSTFCREYKFREMLIWDGPDGSPGFHVSCRKGSRKNRKMLIWIHGGPWAPASRNMVLEQLAFMDSGYDIFIPFYPGSPERRVTFEGPVMVPDVVDALRELKGAFGWARKRYARVDVLGESFGAFLAASLAPELGKKNSLFLHNPSLGGKSRLEEYYAGRTDDELIAGVPTEHARAEVKRITDAYFGRLKDYVPLRLLESTKGLKLKLVYGGRDKLMVPGEMQTLARLAVQGCGVDYRPDNGHESGKTREQFGSFRNLVRCGNGKGPSGRPS
jgi:acetyl esterase/lipase